MGCKSKNTMLKSFLRSHCVHIVYRCVECVCSEFPSEFPTVSVNIALHLICRCQHPFNHMFVILMALVIAITTFPPEHGIPMLQMTS